MYSVWRNLGRSRLVLLSLAQGNGIDDGNDKVNNSLLCLWENGSISD